MFLFSLNSLNYTYVKYFKPAATVLVWAIIRDRFSEKYDWLAVVWRRWHLLNRNFLWRNEKKKKRGLVWRGWRGAVLFLSFFRFFFLFKYHFHTPWSGSLSLLLFWAEDVSEGSGWRLRCKKLASRGGNVGNLWEKSYIWEQILHLAILFWIFKLVKDVILFLETINHLPFNNAFMSSFLSTVYSMWCSCLLC